MANKQISNANKMRERLNEVGPGFCLAKWDQVTLHLHNGMTHSCHHPEPHKIPLEELKKDHRAIHNTLEKQKQRDEMLHGGLPAGCNYCWKVEANKEAVSDRMLKSANLFANRFDEIKNAGIGEKFNPSYVEVSFSNACNFKCLYCGPHFSSKWVQEQEEHDKIHLWDDHSFSRWSYHDVEWLKKTDQLPIPHRDHNPYVEAFWKWWFELRKTLKYLRVTGGEPLMCRDTFKLFEELKCNPIKDLDFSINTNLNAPEEAWKKLIDFIKHNEDSPCVKKFTIFASMDTWGEQAEYIRTGLQFNMFWERLIYLIENHPTVYISIMTTFTWMSIPKFDKFLQEILIIKQKYNTRNENRYDVYKEFFRANDVDFPRKDEISRRTVNDPIDLPSHRALVGRKGNAKAVEYTTNFELAEKPCQLHIDISCLEFPPFLSVGVPDKIWTMPRLWNCYEFMLENICLSDGAQSRNNKNFYDYEAEKMGRVCDAAVFVNDRYHDDLIGDKAKIQSMKINCFKYLSEMDKRRNTNFVKTFPELEDFYNQCKTEFNNVRY